MKKKIYLCHPYSHPDPAVRRQRFESANDLAGRLMRSGFVVFSPLSHSVPIADQLLCGSFKKSRQAQVLMAKT